MPMARVMVRSRDAELTNPSPSLRVLSFAAVAVCILGIAALTGLIGSAAPFEATGPAAAPPSDLGFVTDEQLTGERSAAVCASLLELIDAEVLTEQTDLIAEQLDGDTLRVLARHGATGAHHDLLVVDGAMVREDRIEFERWVGAIGAIAESPHPVAARVSGACGPLHAQVRLDHVAT
jgi:hypothetical protein